MFATVHSEPATIPSSGGLRCCHVCGAIYRNDFQRCPTDGGELSVMAADPLVGKTISEHYVIDALIGEGAMGRVYRAHHARLTHKRYAIKVMLGDLAASAAMRVRFQHEGEAASRLDHPGIVGVVDFGRTRAGLMYLVMDLVEGPTLRRLVRESVLQSGRVMSLARQLADGLAHAHSRGVVHRDLKPDNVLVVGDSARIADFGLAISVTSDDARMTTSGVLCTPLYAAPEQLLGKDIDHRADLYALGATMFEMLTGLPPFQGDANQVMAKKLSSAAPKLASLAPNVPAGLAALVDRMLARRPEGRPSSASEVIEKLDQLTAGVAPPRSWRRIGIAVAAATGMIAVVQLSRDTKVSVASASSARVDPPVPTPSFTGPLEKRTADELPAPVPMTLASFIDRATSPRPRDLVPRLSPVIHPVGPSVSAARVPPPAPHHVAPRIVALDVAGSLSPAVVRRAVERVLPALRGCAGQVGERVVVASFAIGETRRASALQIGGAGSRCLSSAFSSVRTEVVPDLGDVAVQVKVAF
ncbi:MAG: serine/threonine protein kinase [Myxococcales bacterium]|nr:serine/threonine protein kinase [Myxococcales bacterium]